MLTRIMMFTLLCITSYLSQKSKSRGQKRFSFLPPDGRPAFEFLIYHSVRNDFTGFAIAALID